MLCDLPTEVARTTIVPALPEFMATHPELELEVSSTDRQVDLVQEGLDCVLRLGPIGDETLIARPPGLLRMVNAASPAYLARYGVPRSLEDLQRQEHRTIHFSTMLGARPYGWEYPDGDSYATLQLPGALHVNSAQTYEAAALVGLGLIQAPLLGIGRYLESGALVEILPDFRRRALAVSLVVAHRSNLSRRVRAFMKWIEDVLTPYMEFHTADFAFRPADFATLTSLQMRPATLSRSGARSSRSAANRSASSTRCTSIDDYHMSLPRIELGNINHA